MIVALFYNGPLKGERWALESPMPVLRVPMPADPVRAITREAAMDPSQHLSIKVGEYERDVRPSERMSDPARGLAVFYYFWKGVK